MVVLAVHGGAGGDGPWRGDRRRPPTRSVHGIVAQRPRRTPASGEVDALEAVTLAVEAMEDEPLFNAGRGSVLDENGQVGMDASIMRGEDQAAGSVIGLSTTRHPIRAAHRLLVQGWPVMLAGPAGDAFAKKHDLEQMDATWFETDLRRAQVAKMEVTAFAPGATDEEDALLDHDGEEEGGGRLGPWRWTLTAVAAATSTGGMTESPLAAGDTPIIGAGTWADQDIAVSCTGVGELSSAPLRPIRWPSSTEPSGLCRRPSVCLTTWPARWTGGLIAVNTNGEVVMPFQTMLMYRGVYADGACSVGIGPAFSNHNRP